MLLLRSCVLLALSGLCMSVPVEFDYDCTGLPENFIYWWACGSYGVCRGGVYAQIDCINGTTYDRQFRDCVPNTQNPSFPCNSPGQDCVLYNGPGHRYPEQQADPVENLPPCTFYYTCSYGRYLGHQRCNENTVYDEATQRCLPPSSVPPPCGTAVDDGSRTVFAGDNFGNRGLHVVQPQTDVFGNPDYSRWPFTNQGTYGGQRPRVTNRFGNRFVQRDYINSFANAAQPDDE